MTEVNGREMVAYEDFAGKLRSLGLVVRCGYLGDRFKTEISMGRREDGTARVHVVANRKTPLKSLREVLARLAPTLEPNGAEHLSGEISQMISSVDKEIVQIAARNLEEMSARKVAHPRSEDGDGLLRFIGETFGRVTTFDDLMAAYLYRQVAKGRDIHLHMTEGHLKDGWQKEIERRGYKKVSQHQRGRRSLETYMSNDGIIVRYMSAGLHAAIKDVLYTFDPQMLDIIAPMASENVGNLHMMMVGEHGIETMRSMPSLKRFIPSNYPPSVSGKFTEVCEAIRSSSPPGRLFIFEGPKGTGKTSYIEGCIEACKQADFVVVPSHMLSSIGDPTFIKLMTEIRESSEILKSIVLIIEDADHVLAKRGADNISDMSALLNATSGLLGTAFDLKVICTTNRPLKQLGADEALLREMRLACMVQFRELTADEAEIAYAGIRPGAELPKGQPSWSLASLYLEARKDR